VRSGQVEVLRTSMTSPPASNGSGSVVLTGVGSVGGLIAQVVTNPYEVVSIDGGRRAAQLNALNGTIAALRQDISFLKQVAHGQLKGAVSIPVAESRYERFVPLPLGSTTCCVSFIVPRDNIFELMRSSEAQPNAIDPLTGYVYWSRQQWLESLLVTISQEHAALLIKNRRRQLVVLLYIKASLVRVRAHASRVVSGALAVIAVFMSHRHRREPADGWLLSRTAIQSLGVVH